METEREINVYFQNSVLSDARYDLEVGGIQSKELGLPRFGYGWLAY